MDFPNSDFWNYSTQIWTLPDVEKICLALQDNFDTDTNILLYCCWVGDKNLNLSDDDLQTLLDTIQPWQTIIKPLRESRKLMQQQSIAMPSNLKDQTISNMNDMELNAEHMAQLALEKALKLKNIASCAQKPGVNTGEKTEAQDAEINGIGCSLVNIKTYLSTLDSLTSADEIMPQISQLLTAIFQDEEAVQMAMMG